jgi:hypothetical protein
MRWVFIGIKTLSLISGIFFLFLAERKKKERDQKLLEDRLLMKLGKKLPEDIYFSRIEEYRKIAVIYTFSIFLFGATFFILGIEALIYSDFLIAHFSLFVAIYIFYKFFEIIKFYQ